MKILSYRRFALWWQLAMDWFQRQFAAIAASIDFTPVENKLDEVKSDVADVKTAVENIDFSALAKQGSNANATLTAVLEALTGGDAAEQVKDFFGIVKDGDTVKVVTEDGGEEVVEPVGLMDEDDVYDYLEDIAVLMGGITAQQAASITAATRAIIHGGSGSGEGGEGGSGSGSGE